MVNRSFIAVVFAIVAVAAATGEQSKNIYQDAVIDADAVIARGSGPPSNAIDEFVFAKLSSLDIQPVYCSDAVFVRRAYLDVIGTLPTAKEAREFIEDSETPKKAHGADRSPAEAT